MRQTRTRLCAGMFAAVLVAASFAGGCQSQKSLFSEEDATTKNKMKYWDNESALTTTENRRQADTNGFGFPSGPAAQ